MMRFAILLFVMLTCSVQGAFYPDGGDLVTGAYGILGQMSSNAAAMTTQMNAVVTSMTNAASSLSTIANNINLQVPVSAITTTQQQNTASIVGLNLTNAMPWSAAFPGTNAGWAMASWPCTITNAWLCFDANVVFDIRRQSAATNRYDNWTTVWTGLIFTASNGYATNIPVGPIAVTAGQAIQVYCTNSLGTNNQGQAILWGRP